MREFRHFLSLWLFASDKKYKKADQVSTSPDITNNSEFAMQSLPFLQNLDATLLLKLDFQQHSHLGPL